MLLPLRDHYFRQRDTDSSAIKVDRDQTEDIRACKDLLTGT